MMQKLANKVVTVTFRLDATLRDAFRDACVGSDMSSTLRELIKVFTTGKNIKARVRHGQGSKGDR